jgi:hypothetical protein
MLQGSTVFEISGSAGGAKRMAASRVGQAGDLGPALDYMEHVKPGHGLFAEPLALAHAPEQRPLLITGDTGRLDPRCQVVF